MNSEPQHMDVDGVPAWWVNAPVPFTGMLIFRVGRADETLTTAGITHLVEHLAAFPIGQQPYRYNAFVDHTRTVFWASGRPAEVASFLSAVCHNLAALPLDRLEVERRVLRTEADGKQAGTHSNAWSALWATCEHQLGSRAALWREVLRLALVLEPEERISVVAPAALRRHAGLLARRESSHPARGAGPPEGARRPVLALRGRHQAPGTCRQPRVRYRPALVRGAGYASGDLHRHDAEGARDGGVGSRAPGSAAERPAAGILIGTPTASRTRRADRGRQWARLTEPDVRRAEHYRRRKHTAVLAIVFTDISGSTELRERLGEIEYERLREAHDALVKEVVEAGDAGKLVKFTGDGALAVFAEPSASVERSLQLQRAMHGHSHFRLRIGIDMGQVSEKKRGGIVKDVFGRHVNRSARIMSLSEPGQVSTSINVYDAAVGWLRSRTLRWKSLGLVEVEGFAEPIALHEPFEQWVTHGHAALRRRPRPRASADSSMDGHSLRARCADCGRRASRAPLAGASK